MKNQEQIRFRNTFPSCGASIGTPPGTIHGNGASLCNSKAYQQSCSRVPALSIKLKYIDSKGIKYVYHTYCARKGFLDTGNKHGRPSCVKKK